MYLLGPTKKRSLQRYQNYDQTILQVLNTSHRHKVKTKKKDKRSIRLRIPSLCSCSPPSSSSISNSQHRRRFREGSPSQPLAICVTESGYISTHPPNGTKVNNLSLSLSLLHPFQNNTATLRKPSSMNHKQETPLAQLLGCPKLLSLSSPLSLSEAV